MTQLDQVGKHATVVLTTDDNTTSVIYHETQVVRFNYDHVILNSGGWQTQTTKTRMNQASNQFNLGFTVVQKQGKWYVDYKDTTREFKDGMILMRN